MALIYDMIDMIFPRAVVSNKLATSHMWLVDIYFVANQHLYNLNCYFQIESRENMFELFKHVLKFKQSIF